jgi:hypothetical protein
MPMHVRAHRAFALVVFFVVVGLCGCERGEVQQPKATFEIRPADDLLMQRVQAAYAAMRRGGRLWPGFEKTNVQAMLVYDARGEWFFGEARDLRGFYRTGQKLNGVPITYAEPSLFLTQEVKPYATIRRHPNWLGRIGWRDFDPDSRYSRTAPMMILQELAIAMENHHIESTEEWIGIYVHECFHVFQQQFADVSRALRIEEDEKRDREVLEELAETPDYRKALIEEFNILNDAATEATTKKFARHTLKRWLILRNARVRGFQKRFERAGGKRDLDNIDMTLTSVEGTARYVETRYLADPDAFVDEEGRLNRDPQARQYLTDEAIATGTKPSRSPIRSPRYSTGLTFYIYTFGDLAARLLDIADEDWKRKVFTRSNLLLAAVESAIERE